MKQGTADLVVILQWIIDAPLSGGLAYHGPDRPHDRPRARQMARDHDRQPTGNSELLTNSAPWA
jgi:hypothetical protein